MRHGYFSSSGRVYYLLIEFFQLKEHGFGFMGDSYNEKQKGFNDVGYNGFKFSSLVNCSVDSISY